MVRNNATVDQNFDFFFRTIKEKSNVRKQEENDTKHQDVNIVQIRGKHTQARKIFECEYCDKGKFVHVV